ncbi:MAG: polymer-forming cytoskeletal protein, partial [Anaerolineae bacterium]
MLDRNTSLTGTLHSEGNVLIEGSFEGEIQAKETIFVEEDARAKGQLQADQVIVSGSFDGNAV